MPLTLKTERLVLRPVNEEDAELIFKMYNQPIFLEHIGDRGIGSVEAACDYISTRFIPQIKRLGYGNFLIVRDSDGEKLGAVGIFEREGLAVQDIGFSLLAEFEGQGYAFEAAKKLLDTAFSQWNIPAVSAITTQTNYPSQKLIEKLGLRYVKTVQLLGDEEILRYYEIDNPNKIAKTRQQLPKSCL